MSVFMYQRHAKKCPALMLVLACQLLLWLSQPFLTSTQIKRPCKKPRLELEEEHKSPLEGRSSMDI